MTDEEERAIQYRVNQRKRIANRIARERQLAGSAAARQELADDWAPYLLARIPIEDIPNPEDEVEIK